MAFSKLQKIYAERFEKTGIDKRKRVWALLCNDFFNDLVGPDKTVLDLACGYGEFINSINAKKKIAVDLNPDAPDFVDADVEFHASPATDLPFLQTGTVDVVFTSNFLEHLHDKGECDHVFAEVLRVLRPGGRFIVMGPNIRYAYKEYWDYYDHYLPLSHLSLAEGLTQAGYRVVQVIPRFLPYTMNSSMPTSDFLVRAYLRLPFAWRFFGKQFLEIAEKPA
jgi:SAM-dependent methyltransferase